MGAAVISLNRRPCVFMRPSMTSLWLIATCCLAFAQTPRKDGAKPDTGADVRTSASVEISPSSLDFKDQVAKMPSKPLRITLTNTGGKDLYIRSVEVGGENLQDFRIAGDTCTGATVSSQKSCVVDVIFTPAATGTRTALITVTDDASDSPQKAKLSGNGINSVDVPPSRGSPSSESRDIL
jgi:hypothetical protein